MGSFIQEITISPLQAPLLQTFRIAIGQHDSLHNFLVTLTLQDGTVGFGEAAVATHITGETLLQTKDNLTKAAHDLKGRNAKDYLEISNGLHESFPHNQCVVAAIETALLDAITKQQKMPLWKMFGARAHRLKSDITIVIASIEETEQKTQEFYQAGFRAFKIKIGQDPDMDFKRVLAVSKLAPKSQIILDANQGYNDKQAIEFLKTIAKAGITVDLLEQPVPKDDLEGLKRVTKASKVAVCADESASSIEQVRALIKNKMVNAINIKLMKTGLLHAFEIAKLAHAHKIKLMIGGMMESNVAMTAAAHLAAGLGYIDFVDLDTPFFIKGEVVRNPYLNKSGVYDLTKAQKGIGIKPMKTN